MPPIRCRTEAEDWLVRRLALEGTGLWTLLEYQELGKKPAQLPTARAQMADKGMDRKAGVLSASG